MSRERNNPTTYLQLSSKGLPNKLDSSHKTLVGAGKASFESVKFSKGQADAINKVYRVLRRSQYFGYLTH